MKAMGWGRLFSKKGNCSNGDHFVGTGKMVSPARGRLLGMSAQLMLFETDSEQQKDGSLVVRPRRLLTGEEIGVERAGKLLGYKDRESVYRLIELGEIRAWKPKGKRGNARWRIDLQSLLDYKARRLRDAANQGRTVGAGVCGADA